MHSIQEKTPRSGLVAFVTAVLLLNGLFVFGLSHFHTWRERVHKETYERSITKIRGEEEVLRADIVRLEGVTSWEETMYAQKYSPK